MQCRTPHGVRELKRVVWRVEDIQEGRTPHGVRELKLQLVQRKLRRLRSHPTRGA